MVRITENLIRKRSEHNECLLSTLEEVALHQLDIEKIEHLDKWCRNLKILLLQNNLIPRMENLNKLKYLHYINLALNNIELIEGVSGCENLSKLDLTVNFIGNLTTSIDNLQQNTNLKQLYLTGNPCTEYPNYRHYVVHKLPQLQQLDGAEVSLTERLQAKQAIVLNSSALQEIIKLQQLHAVTRQQQKQNYQVSLDDDTEEPFTPESRVAAYKAKLQQQTEKEQSKNASSSSSTPHQPSKSSGSPIFFSKQGAPLNINQPKLPFLFFEKSNHDQDLFLEVAIPKFMDTSLLQVDLQPTYIRIKVKDKYIQLVLPEEVKPDNSTSTRNRVTGKLLLTMPKLNPPSCVPRPPSSTRLVQHHQQDKDHQKPKNSRTSYLEVENTRLKLYNTLKLNATKNNSNKLGESSFNGAASGDNSALSNGSVENDENPDVPPLI